jgi:hypothetical protein
MGIYAVYENAIRLMVPRDLHLGDEEFDQVQVGERIRIEIQKSRFQLKDPFIVSVGIYRGRAGAPTRVITAVAEGPVKTQVSPAPEEVPVEEAVSEGEEEEGAEEQEEEGAEEE